jgi:hypothetical protein
MKQIQLKTTNPIEIRVEQLLLAVNKLRNDHGEKKKDKLPVKIGELLSRLKIFENRDASNSALGFCLNYEDAEKVPCIRDFPNFGLDVKSASSIEHRGDTVLLSVDLTVRAGKAKWQVDEVAECARLFSSGGFTMDLMVTLDETTDWGGHSAQVSTLGQVEDSVGLTHIPASHFKAEMK